MDENNIILLIDSNKRIIYELEENNFSEARKLFIDGIRLFQTVMFGMVYANIYDEAIIASLIKDALDGIDNHDKVLLLDTLKYGINSILKQILDEMEMSYE